ncbi:MAG TPA: formylglycine-generating enzyme family protein [bacterium]|nr:formylglycine-generating enzyme family protein [bacterium]
MKKFMAIILTCVVVLFAVSCGGDGTEMPDTEQPDVDYGTGTPGEMVSVPAGEFQMGCNSAVDDQCGGDESPYHAVTLSAYKIGKYEVTVGEYQQCVTNGACNNNGENYHYYTNTDYESCNYGAEGKGIHPMQCVTWYGAKAYCEWIGGRLPTEAEWEKAARGTDGRKYPWGNEPTVSCDYVVMFDSNAGGLGCGTGGTMPVGSKPNGISPYGAYDMIGNVWEWVNDWYASGYYASSPTNDPTGPETGDARVLRGGSWRSYDDNRLRASSRYLYNPGGSSYYYLGFRCAK